MPPAKPRPNNKLQNLIASIRRDPQKAGILTVLVAILVVLQFRLALKDKGGPSSATASSTIKSDKPGATPSPGARHEARNALNAWLDQPAESVNRNLFTVNLDRFPQDSGKITSSSARGSMFWDELAKSMSHQADVKRERRVLYENLQQQASQLRLQSTMMGAHPKAVINGGMVREGDVVASGAPGDSRSVTFRVLKIEARRIIVEREGIKLEIQMK